MVPAQFPTGLTYVRNRFYSADRKQRSATKHWLAVDLSKCHGEVPGRTEHASHVVGQAYVAVVT
jgi:hypothetical protein